MGDRHPVDHRRPVGRDVQPVAQIAFAGGMRNVIQIGAAALLITSIGAGIAIVLVFVNRLHGA